MRLGPGDKEGEEPREIRLGVNLVTGPGERGRYSGRIPPDGGPGWWRGSIWTFAPPPPTAPRGR